MKFLLAASADIDHRLFCLHVFSMGLFFKLHNLLLAAVCHDISKKSSHLKTCNLVPVCHQLKVQYFDTNLFEQVLAEVFRLHVCVENAEILHRGVHRLK